MIVDMESYSPIFTGLFLRTRKINISLVFISQSYFKSYIKVPKTIRLIIRLKL